VADAPYRLTIQEGVKQSYENSKAHGFWDNEETAETIPSKLALIHSEVSEALESYRNPESDNLVPVPTELIERLLDEGNEATESYPFRDLAELYRKWLDKPKGLDVELADIVIRVFDFAGSKSIDLEGAIRRKHEYNVGRPAMHGRKV
jgi:NTP pyrophosphatase (non-canonical NTP hydrolase)